MSGHFHKIVGKTIQGVYCRKNEQTPKGQVFLVFDDDTYFEIYSTSYGGLNGTKGLDLGDMEKVVNLNHPKGEEACRYQFVPQLVRKMWFPSLHKHLDKQSALGVPARTEVETFDEYMDLLVNHLQDLIDQISESEARELIETYLLEGEELIKNYNREAWGEGIIIQDEMDLLLADLILEPGNKFTSLKEIVDEEITLENVLKVIQKKFVLTEEDDYILKKVDEWIVGNLHNPSLVPNDIISLGKALKALRCMPASGIVDGYISITFGESPSVDVNLSSDRFSILAGGEDGCYLLDWSVSMDGVRDTEDDAYILDDEIFWNMKSISIEDESNMKSMHYME